MKRKIILLILFFALAFVNKNEAQTNYYLVNGGNITSITDWGTNTNGTGTNPSNFVSGDIWNITNNTSITLSAAWNLDAAATINVGDGTNATAFILASGSSIANALSINVTQNATLDLESTFTSPVNPSFSSGSTIIFGTNTSNIPANTYYNVTINNSVNLNSNAVGINGLLTVSTGNIFTIDGSLTLSGTIAGPGTIAGDNSISSLILSGTGNMGTLNFESGFQVVSNLNVALQTSMSTVSLGTDLLVDNAFVGAVSFNSGGFNLNGNNLTIGSGMSTNFNGGTLLGSSASILQVQSNFISAGSLLMDATSNTLRALVLNSSSGVNLQVGSVLNITDSLSVLAGTLTTGNFVTLESTSSLKGRAGRVGGTISGNVTVETFIPGGTTGWANLGVNGVTGQSVSNWDTYVSSGGTNGIPMTCSGCAYSESSLGSWFNSIASWNEAASDYDTSIVASSSLVTGKGYWVYVGDGPSTTNDLMLVNSGPLVQGSVTFPLTSTSGTAQGYNLVANPYASPISWAKVLALSSNVNNAIYVWNADISGGSYTQYVGGVSSPGGAGSINDIIPAGQGFYVQATANTNLVFNEGVKMDANTGANPLLRPTSSNTVGKIFRLKLKGSNDADETVFRIHPDATPGFDESWDAHKIFQSPGYVGYPGPYTKYTSISSKDASNTDYSINSLPPLTNSLSIPVLAKVSGTGTYTISAFDFKDFDMCVGLIDKTDNSYHDLRMNDYVFTIHDTTSTPRFQVILCRDPYVDLVSVPQQELSNSITINQDLQGAYVKTAFAQNTKATISVYNIIGQKLTDDIHVEGTVTNTQLNLDVHNQVVLIRVVTNKESSTKKIVIQ
jgi:hypothetical protein